MSDHFERPAPLDQEQIDKRRAEMREQKVRARKMSLFDAEESIRNTAMKVEVEEKKVNAILRVAEALDRIAEQLSKR